ncbi:hypothetical protein C8R45DRAFT_1212356, partial [Mycena sanguinolenta]
ASGSREPVPSHCHGHVDGDRPVLALLCCHWLSCLPAPPGSSIGCQSLAQHFLRCFPAHAAAESGYSGSLALVHLVWGAAVLDAGAALGNRSKCLWTVRTLCRQCPQPWRGFVRRAVVPRSRLSFGCVTRSHLGRVCVRIPVSGILTERIRLPWPLNLRRRAYWRASRPFSESQYLRFEAGHGNTNPAGSP